MAIDHTMVQGDTVALDFAIVDNAGDAVDLTGASIKWHMARSVYSEPDVEKALSDGIAFVDDGEGTFTVTLDSADTEDLVGTFYHEVEITDSNGNISTPHTGSISILPALIKPEP